MEPAHSLLTHSSPPLSLQTTKKVSLGRRRLPSLVVVVVAGENKKRLQACGGKMGIKASFSLFHKKSIIYKHLNTFYHIHGVLSRGLSVKIAICPPLEKLNEDLC